MFRKSNLLSWDQDVAASPRDFHETDNNRTNSAALSTTTFLQYFSFRHIRFSKLSSDQKLSQIIHSYLSNGLSFEQGKRSFQISGKSSCFAKIDSFSSFLKSKDSCGLRFQTPGTYLARFRRLDLADKHLGKFKISPIGANKRFESLDNMFQTKFKTRKETTERAINKQTKHTQTRRTKKAHKENESQTSTQQTTMKVSCEMFLQQFLPEKN